MKLRQECIGSIMTVRLDNGYTQTVTIEDNRKLFKYYKSLGLDVFEVKKKKSESTSESD